ncbi:MAG TPA: acetyltransferase [Thermoplasmata archaeon]|nr:acetyltransferase [Thermoplasmata archaeon]HIH29134.1 acetyltransferase [Thermoplasmata archaeon]
MKQQSIRKKELDSLRTQWRKSHRTLNGRIILYPDKPPEHINARGSKLYNWFWGKILRETKPEEIPAIVSGLQDAIHAEKDTRKIQILRTMIGMADDAYQFKQLEDIKDFDTELQLEHKPVFNAEDGVIYRSGKIYTTDYNEDESEILIRDIEGIIIDMLSSEDTEKNASPSIVRNNTYKNWKYMEKI